MENPRQRRALVPLSGMNGRILDETKNRKKGLSKWPSRKLNCRRMRFHWRDGFFNLGVEIGQLLIVAGVLGMAWVACNDVS